MFFLFFFFILKFHFNAIPRQFPFILQHYLFNILHFECLCFFATCIFKREMLPKILDYNLVLINTSSLQCWGKMLHANALHPNRMLNRLYEIQQTLTQTKQQQ